MDKNLEGKLNISHLEILMQPIVSPNQDLTAGVEALSQGVDLNGKHLTFSSLLKRAKHSDCQLELELALFEKALIGFENIQSEYDNVLFFINISDLLINHFLETNTLLDLIDGHHLPYNLIVFDVNQLDPSNMENTKAFIEFYRSHGFFMCIDSVTSDYTILGKILHFEPDMIKIDITHFDRLENKKYREFMPKFVKIIAEQFGMIIIGKKVDKKSHAIFGLEFGIQFMQGIFVSKPVDLETNPLDDLIAHYRKRITPFYDELGTDIDIDRIMSGKVIGIIRELAKFVKTIPLNEIKKHEEYIFTHYPMLQNLWLLSEDGKMLDQNIINEKKYVTKHLAFFQIYNEGADYSSKEHYYALKTGILDVWVTHPFRSILTNNICIGCSVELGEDFDNKILCININFDELIQYLKS